jgi:hypothetical protein
MTLFSGKQIQAIELLAQGKAVGKVCDELKIGYSTMSLWRSSEGFKEAISERAKEIIKDSNAALYSGLSAAMPEYLGILDEIIRDKKTNNAVRLRGIALALQNQLQLRGLDVDAEIQELKEIMEDRKNEEKE